MDSTFLLKHDVDLSLLTDGFHIRAEMQPLLYALPGGELRHGENRMVKIMIDGEFFSAKLYNIDFNQTKYPDRTDLLQIRYTAGSPIARKLQSKFHADYEYLKMVRNEVGPRRQIRLPDDNHDEIVFYGTTMPDVYILDCINGAETDLVAKEVSQMDELDFETLRLREDTDATIREVTRLQRIRKLDRSIGESLKKLYDFRCQMSGEKIGSEHEVEVVEAHHIDPFTRSMNNNTSNIIILSPNYHRIIHKANPTFDKKNLSFIFPNGLVEKIKINKHL